MQLVRAIELIVTTLIGSCHYQYMLPHSPHPYIQRYEHASGYICMHGHACVGVYVGNECVGMHARVYMCIHMIVITYLFDILLLLLLLILLLLLLIIIIIIIIILLLFQNSPVPCWL